MKKIWITILTVLILLPAFTTNSSAEELITIPQVVMLNDFKGEIYAAEFSQDDKFLATGDNQYEVKIWNAQNGRLINSFKHPFNVSALAYSPDNRIIASGDQLGNLYLWDVTSGDLLKELPLTDKVYGSQVYDLTFDESGNILYVVSENRNELTLWNVNTGELIDEYSFQNKPTDIAYNPIASTIAIGLDNGKIAIRDGKTGDYIKELDNTKLSSIADLKYSPDFKSLVAIQMGSYKNNSISYLDAKNYNNIEFDYSTYKNYNGYRQLDFSPDSNFIALSNNGNGYIYNTNTHELVSNVEFTKNGSTVTFNHSGTRVFMGKTIFDTTVLPVREVTGIELVATSEVLKIGDSLNFSANYVYNDGHRTPVDISTLSVTSSNTAVLKTMYGKMMALNEGKSTLKISDGQYTDQSTIYVNNYKELAAKTNVAINKEWKVNVSLDVKESSLTEQNIYITDSKGKKIPSTSYFVKGKQPIIYLKPLNNYLPGETYTVWVREIESATGETLKEFTKMDFTVQK